MTTEPFEGTVRFLGVRASFTEAKRLLADVLTTEQIDSELRDEIAAFLAQFETDA